METPELGMFDSQPGENQSEVGLNEKMVKPPQKSDHQSSVYSGMFSQKTQQFDRKPIMNAGNAVIFQQNTQNDKQPSERGNLNLFYDLEQMQNDSVGTASLLESERSEKTEYL